VKGWKTGAFSAKTEKGILVCRSRALRLQTVWAISNLLVEICGYVRNSKVSVVVLGAFAVFLSGPGVRCFAVMGKNR
jgi:hypothetical protein